MSDQLKVRFAGPADAADAARLLDRFNTEYDTFTPGVPPLTRRLEGLLESGEATIPLVGEGPDGIAVVRFRPSLYTETFDAYLEELYVVPERRGEGLGQALMEAVLEHARTEGAGFIHLGTSVDDTAARGLYEKLGFTDREGSPDGPLMIFYERDL